MGIGGNWTRPHPAIAFLGIFAALLLIAPAPGRAASLKDFASFTKDLAKSDGLFTVYRDKKTGEAYLAVKADQLGKDFIQFAATVDAVAEADSYRGDFRQTRIIKIARHYQRLEFVAQNTNYTFNPKSALSRAAGADISNAVVASETIVAATPDESTLLISADDLLLEENFTQVRPTDDPNNKNGEEYQLGKLSSDKTRLSEINNFPENTNFVIDYVYDNPQPLNYGGTDITDGRYVTVKVQESLIELPPSDYTPRRDDYRIGYFTQERTDLTSTSAAPYADVIDRWNLKKKDPAAALSEPVKPITYWIENTTPRAFRPAIKKAVLAWNKAFEAAGFKNAIEVKEQPDNADWGAGDIRYNLIRWTAAPNPRFSGYGPSLANPLTGEIIHADIMIDYGFITKRLRREEIFGTGNDKAERDTPERAGEDGQGAEHCDYSRMLQYNLMLGKAALEARGASTLDEKRMIDEAVQALVLHEVGHTLGLTHNFKASSIRPLAELQDTDMNKYPITGSVMDYLPVNLALKGQKQGVYFQDQPGPYDVWAIQYGYTPALADAKAEAAREQKLLARSASPELAFGNDFDDMKDIGDGIDPHVMEGDLSADPVAWANARIGLIDDTMADLKAKFIKPDASYQALRTAYAVLTDEISKSADVLSRYIGGIYVERAAPDAPGAKPPFTPVPLATQKAALAALAKRIFAPDAFDVPADLARYLQIQRRGFDLSGDTEDPKILQRALTIQTNVIRQLIYPTTLARLSNSSLYGNAYPVDAFLSDLTAAIFDADKNSNVNAFRQNLQTVYVESFANVIGNQGVGRQYDAVARAAILHQLKKIDTLEANRLLFRWFGLEDAQTIAHREHMRLIIARALSTSDG